MKQESCAAPARLPRLSQVVNTETVSVRTPRYSLAPISFSVSSDTSADADRERRPRHRQRDPPEGGPAAGAKRLRCLSELRALELEHRARRKIDVRIQHQRDHDDRAGQRAQTGKHAHRVLQRKPDRERAMDQAQRLEQIDIDISREIGRDRERQRHQPQQHRPAAKFMQRDRPRGAGADRERQGADAEEQAPRYREASAAAHNRSDAARHPAQAASPARRSR